MRHRGFAGPSDLTPHSAHEPHCLEAASLARPVLLTRLESQSHCLAADSRGTGSAPTRPGRTHEERAWPSFTEFRGHGFTADSRGPGPNSAVTHPLPIRQAVHIFHTTTPLHSDQPGGHESACHAGSQGFLKLIPASKNSGARARLDCPSYFNSPRTEDRSNASMRIEL